MRDQATPSRMQFYVWDSRTETWSGPSSLDPHRDSGRLLASLQSAPGGSWYGRLNCGADGQEARFFVLIHALCDCALSLIYCDDSKTGPAEIVVTIPSDGGTRLRSDFAFELVAFARFLGGLDEGTALKVHDLIASAIADAQTGDALIFSISTGLWTSDLDYILSNCVERVATATLQWLAERLAPDHSPPGAKRRKPS
jgi:hypothetical protein